MPSALKVSALAVINVLVLVNLHIHEPVIEGQDKVHASIAFLAPVKPHHDLTPEL